jgi:hypothetical protein
LWCSASRANRRAQDQPPVSSVEASIGGVRGVGNCSPDSFRRRVTSRCRGQRFSCYRIWYDTPYPLSNPLVFVLDRLKSRSGDGGNRAGGAVMAPPSVRAPPCPGTRGRRRWRRGVDLVINGSGRLIAICVRGRWIPAGRWGSSSVYLNRGHRSLIHWSAFHTASKEPKPNPTLDLRFCGPRCVPSTI